MAGKLTARQEAFVREYLVDLNAAAAARRAGYSERTADRIGHENLRKPEIAEAVSRAQTERAGRVGILADDVLRELLLLAKSDIGEVLDFSGAQPRLRQAKDIPERARRAIASIKVRHVVEARAVNGEVAPVDVEIIEFKLWDKPGAVYKAMQHLGLLKDKVDVHHTGEVRITSVAIAEQETDDASPGGGGADEAGGG